VQDSRFRDFRTKVQRAGRNPKPTQRAMNHADLASIFRYIAVVDEEVRTYVEAAQAAQSDAQTPHDGGPESWLSV
jgi:hypothetical protein